MELLTNMSKLHVRPIHVYTTSEWQMQIKQTGHKMRGYALQYMLVHIDESMKGFVIYFKGIQLCQRHSCQ